jgi:thiosulfate dehydrogenase
MKKFFFGGMITGGILAALLIALAGYVYFAGGLAPVATSAPPMPFEKTLARLALNARIKAEMPKSAPLQATESNFLAGATVYSEDCAVCHGLPGGEETAIGKGMFPHPPQLFHGKGVTDDPVGETYWKVANGIRLTGMPGFKKALTDTQLWQVSLLLAHADLLPASVTNALAPAEPPGVKVRAH